MKNLTLTLSQVRFVNKAFWRNPTRAFFTFVFPLMFLVIFTALLGSSTVHIGSLSIRQSTYYVAAMASFGVITACFNNIAVGMTFQRDSGVLKRVSGTPLPSSSFLGARVLHSLFIAMLLVAITAVFGRVAFDANLPADMALVDFLVMLAIGASSFCALGLAIAAFIPNADAAVPIVNAVIMPLLFLSGIFIPLDNGTPSWITWVARIFPVRHFALGVQSALIGTPFHWSDVAVVAVWGLAGLVVASRYFSWEPRV